MAQAAKRSANTLRVVQRIKALDWTAAEQSLSERGYAITAPILSPDECASLAALYNDASRFRSHVIMERYRFGIGDYKYFANPLPELVAELRSSAYLRLRPPIGDHREARVSAASELRDQFRERIGKIFVVADAEPVALHNDVAAKAACIVIKRGDLRTFRCRQNGSCNGIAALRERLLRAAPVQRLDSFGDGRCDRARFCCLSHAASAIRNSSHKRRSLKRATL